MMTHGVVGDTGKENLNLRGAARRTRLVTMLGNLVSRNKIPCRSNQRIASAMVTHWLRSWHTVSPNTKDRFELSLVSRHTCDAMTTLKKMMR